MVIFLQRLFTFVPFSENLETIKTIIIQRCKNKKKSSDERISSKGVMHKPNLRDH